MAAAAGGILPGPVDGGHGMASPRSASVASATSGYITPWGGRRDRMISIGPTAIPGAMPNRSYIPSIALERATGEAEAERVE